MNYREWEASVPTEIKSDSVWKAEAYRLALFLSDLSWHDATKLMRDKRTISLADQLYRSAGGNTDVCFMKIILQTARNIRISIRMLFQFTFHVCP